MSASEYDAAMSRWAICPLGEGSQGVYDRTACKFVATFPAPWERAYAQALSEWHTRVGTRVPGRDRAVPAEVAARPTTRARKGR